MNIVFAQRIAKKEKINSNDQYVLAKSFAKGVFADIKGEDLPKNSRLVKLYMTTVDGHSRAVFLIDVKSKDGFFLFYRSKNDPVGKNITIKNKLFKVALHKYLLILKEDILDKKYEMYCIK